MGSLFEIKDKNNKLIHLTKETWKHIVAEHSMVIPYLKYIDDLINKPTKITKYLYDENIWYYYKYIKNINSKSKYLLVIVKYLNGEGFIITAYFVRSIK